MALRAKQIMSERISVGPDTTVKDAARKMMAFGQPGLPVVNEKMEVVGILSEFNVLGAIREGMNLSTVTAALYNMGKVSAVYVFAPTRTRSAS